MRQQVEINRKNMVIGALVLIFLAAGSWLMSYIGAEEAVLHRISKEQIQEFVEIRGIVELDEEETIYSQIPGIVSELRVEEGAVITSGTLLARLEPGDYQLVLERAKNAYAGARAAAEDVKQSIRPETIRQAELQQEQAEIAVEAAVKNWRYQKERADRVRELYKEGAVSKQYVKDMESMETAAESALHDAERSLQIAQKNLVLLRKGVPKETVETARAQADQAGVQVAEARRMLQKTEIFGRIDGTVLTKHVRLGAVVDAGTPIYTVGDPTTAYIRIDLLVDDAENVRVGQSVEITGDILGKRIILGTIDTIAPKAENKISSLGIEQQRIEMRIRLDNLDRLRPGYGVDVRIVTAERTDALTAPEKAVFEWKGHDHVFVVEKGRLVLRPVTIGLENDDKVEIIEGIRAGEVVVDDPEKKLRVGMRIKPKANR